MNYDFVWGASPSRVSSFRFGNPKIILSSYIPFNRDPNGTRSLTYWKDTHSDWVLYQCDRKTPVRLKDDPNIGVDISNPEVLEWQVREYAYEASRAGFSMLAVDNIQFQNFFGACGIWKDKHTWIQLYSGEYADDKFRNDTIRWLSEMRAALNSMTPPLGMVVNYRPDFSSPKLSLDQTEILNVADAVLDGGGFTNFGESFANESAWVETVKFMLATQEKRKAYFSINQFNAIAPNVLNWVLASYLMAKGKSSSVYITTVDSGNGKPHFGGLQWQYEYGAQIGYPVNSIYSFSGVYRRDYSNGVVLVNHGNATVVSLTSAYYTLHGDRVENVSLDLRGAVVLMKKYVVRDPAGATLASASAQSFSTIHSLLLFVILFSFFTF